MTGGIIGGKVLGTYGEDLGSAAGKEIYEAFYNE